VEPVTVFPLPPVVVTPAEVDPELPAADTAGSADCTAPVESVAVLPPPTCAVPVDPVTVLPLPPVVETAAVAGTAVFVVPAEPAVEGAADWRAPEEPVAVLPPPSWTVPVDPVTVLPLLPVVESPAVAGNVVFVVAAVRSAEGSADWTAPVEPVAVLPPPTWTAPVSFEAVLPPPGRAIEPPTEAGRRPVEVMDGSALIAPTCTAPVEPLAVLPPPTWTAPVLLLALFVPPAPTLAGAATCCCPAGVEALALAPSLTPPVWTTPVDPLD
jgi:hypothetical protein